MRSILISLLFFCLTIPVSAQVTSDSIDIEAALFSTFSQERSQGFWLVKNRWGIFDDHSANVLGRYSIEKTVDENQFFDLGGGIVTLGRFSEQSSIYFPEGYLEAKVGFIHFGAGRKRQTYGEVDDRLSSGSVGLSSNATPIPRIQIFVPDFIVLPYTNGWLEFKGHFSHGWFTGNRRVPEIPSGRLTSLEGSYLHDKSFYLQTGSDSGYKFYVGLVHFAEWGGRTGSGRQLPNTLSDFFKVVGASRGDAGSPGVDQVNSLGAHYGLWDWGVKADIDGVDVHGYYQHLFSDGSGLTYRNRGDGLYGLSIRNLFESDAVTGILWEYLYTKHQTGPGLTDPQAGDHPSFCDEVNCGYRFNGRDDYYNNGYYLSGWSYYSKSVGSPLFLTQADLNIVDSEIETYSDRYFVSTRIAAHHFGVTGQILSNLSYRFLATRTRHYGTYWGANFGQPWGSLNPDRNPEDYFFQPPVSQWYMMFETEYFFTGDRHVSLQVALAIDRGDLTNNTGMLIGVKWRR